MPVATSSSLAQSSTLASTAYSALPQQPSALVGLQVIRRNRAVVDFNADKITLAMTKAFIAVQGERSVDAASVREKLSNLTKAVVAALVRRLPDGGTISIEDIQDQVELALMRAGEHDVARAYVLYRERRAALRLREQTQAQQLPVLHYQHQGQRLPLEAAWLLERCQNACANLSGPVQPEQIVERTRPTLYNDMSLQEVRKALILAARTLIEHHPSYSFAAARLLLDLLYDEVTGRSGAALQLESVYAGEFERMLERGVRAELLDPRLLEFDLPRLAQALQPEQDRLFGYLGLQTLYDRYFLHIEQQRIELPQVFFMRVAMGLALHEVDREASAIAFYQILSRFDFMSSTPTLFNSGTLRSQLSSCYLTTVPDDLDGIYRSVHENAMLQKFAGGLGNDWTAVRAMGSKIKGTNGYSQGLIPFLKVVNDTALAVNQGGKRKGAVCAYLETWHLDIEEFLDLRKNTGDDRRRTHDMNTAHWIPDLFMQRVMEDASWTLFSPNEVKDLHDLVGPAFEQAYCAYEAAAEAGRLQQFKKVSAVQLWRKMLTMLYETGHPWLTFKDPCNLRSPQQHVGVVHGSNLCTEITLNTSDTETAVCNLGSVNLCAHIKDGALDHVKLKQTIGIALRMLDNVVDVNYYPSVKARNANVRHRPVGLGIMGFADSLQMLGLAYASEAAIVFADRSMEAVCYYAYEASTELARERGAYSSFKGSLWDQGVLPHESMSRLAAVRKGYWDCDSSCSMDWGLLKQRIAQYGMRNSNCVAIAPTATIANIVGVSPSIEPIYQNLYVKSNLSGEFTVVNPILVNELMSLGLWDEMMVADLKYFDGSLAQIDRVSKEIKAKYATAFEIDPKWLIEAAARRQKWIDQAQSLNLYVSTPSGKKLDEIYKLAWIRGLKTTYYLRSLGASHAEKISVQETGPTPAATATNAGAIAMCRIDDAQCEACQ